MDWCAGIGLHDQNVPVGDHTIRVHRGGDGPPLVLLHGNPTHSYLWRKALPSLLPHFDCLAVDLAGFGASTEQHQLGIADHAAVVASVVEQLIMPGEQPTWLAHDWGVAIAFTALARIPGVLHAIAFAEGHVSWIPSWDSAQPGFASLFRPLRGEPDGTEYVVTQNRFIEEILLGSLPQLTETEKSCYRSPFQSQTRRRAILRLVREIPVGDDPADMAEVLQVVDAGLADPGLPKLLLQATPGAVIDSTHAARIAARARNLTSVGIGSAGHFVPEEQPEAIASAVIRRFA